MLPGVLLLSLIATPILGRSICPNPSQHLCGVECVNYQTNPQHCGSCHNACPSGQYCVNGACNGCPNVCPSGQYCVNGACSECSSACPSGQYCVNGACSECPTTCAGHSSCVNGACTCSNGPITNVYCYEPCNTDGDCGEECSFCYVDPTCGGPSDQGYCTFYSDSFPTGPPSGK